MYIYIYIYHHSQKDDMDRHLCTLIQTDSVLNRMNIFKCEKQRNAGQKFHHETRQTLSVDTHGGSVDCPHT